MLKKIILIYILINSLAILAQEDQSKKWTLKECVEYAIANNSKIKQALLDIQSADVEKKQSIYNFIPNLNATSSYSMNEGKNVNPATNLFETEFFHSASGGVNASVTIFNGLKKWRFLQAAKLKKMLSEKQLEKIKDDVSLVVINAYLDLLTNKEILKVLQSQKYIIEQNIERTKELIEAGTLPKGDMLQLLPQLATQEKEIVKKQNDIFISKMGLAQILTIGDYENFDIDGEAIQVYEKITDKSVGDIVELSKKQLKAIEIARINLEISKNSVDIFRADLMPTLTAGVSYSSRWSGSIKNKNFWEQIDENKGVSAGLQLQIPIFNGWSARARVKQQINELEKSKIQLSQTELDLEKEVYQIYYDAVNSEQLLIATEASVEAKKEAYDYAFERYQLGAINTFEFDQARKELENSQIELTKAKNNYIFKLKIIEFYTGMLQRNMFLEE